MLPLAADIRTLQKNFEGIARSRPASDPVLQEIAVAAAPEDQRIAGPAGGTFYPADKDGVIAAIMHRMGTAVEPCKAAGQAEMPLWRPVDPGRTEICPRAGEAQPKFVLVGCKHMHRIAIRGNEGRIAPRSLGRAPKDKRRVERQ